MNPFQWGFLLGGKEDQTQEKQDDTTQDQKTESAKKTMDSEKKAGVFEWAWFIAWGLLIPMLFFLFYGFMGLIVGLVLFAIYLTLVYISVKPEAERKGLEDKSERLQIFVDERTEKLHRANREMVSAVRRSIIRNIPGFRTQTPWKMFVASIFYLFTIMILYVAFSQGSYGLAILLALTGILFVSGTQDEMS